MKHREVKINLFSFVKWKICDIWNDQAPPNMRLRGEENKWVYLIYNPRNGLTKIGRSNDVHRRYIDLANASGCPLEIIAAIELTPNLSPCDKLLERVLHEYYHSKRIQGEWFRLSVWDICRIIHVFYEIFGEDMIDNSTTIYAKHKAKTSPQTQTGNGQPHNRQRAANDKLATELRSVSGE
jgi:hypothetical protein